jgi:hypothetical protein
MFLKGCRLGGHCYSAKKADAGSPYKSRILNMFLWSLEALASLKLGLLELAATCCEHQHVSSPPEDAFPTLLRHIDN